MENKNLEKERKIKQQKRKEAEQKILKAQKELQNQCIDYQSVYGIRSLHYTVEIEIPLEF